MNIFLWHVHGSWTTNFVQGVHDYFVPVVPDRGPEGRGRARTWEWPRTVREVTPEEAHELPVDAVVLQRPEELLGWTERWLGGRRPGRDVPAVYVEHNTPQGRIDEMQHPAANRPDLTIAHVTHFNALFWDTGSTATAVLEHGIVDPGHRYTGELPRVACVINEPTRRARVVGTDLLPAFAGAAPLDLFGMGTEAVGGLGNLTQSAMFDELARRRVYLHPFRWTSLGLSLIEAMQLGMPVVALATTATPDAIPAGAGVVSTRIDELTAALRAFTADADLARAAGDTARAYARKAFGLERFLERWDRLLAEVVR